MTSEKGQNIFMSKEINCTTTSASIEKIKAEKKVDKTV